jgi:hypothetical protein
MWRAGGHYAFSDELQFLFNRKAAFSVRFAPFERQAGASWFISLII